ncbi:MAG: AI-2E family transporter [Bdellovibrionales bacterium]
MRSESFGVPGIKFLLGLAVFAVFVALMWCLKPVLLPFVAGMAIAYFLAPVVQGLTRLRVARWIGAFVVLLGFVVIVAAIGMLVVPLIADQARSLIENIPGYVQEARTNYLPWLEKWMRKLAPGDFESLRGAASSSAVDAAGWIGDLIKKVVSGSFVLLDALGLLLITPVVAFLMMRDWPKITGAIDALFPRRYYDIIHGQLADIDATLAGFVRGQALVCVCMGIVYSVGLSLVGLQSSVAIGVVAGLLGFIPFMGTVFVWIASMIVALGQFNNAVDIGLVAAVIAIGNTLDAYLITPKLVGERVGLHPVWILFALMAGAQLMGFTGVLIALPTAAVVGVLTRFALKTYKSSAFYGLSRSS